MTPLIIANWKMNPVSSKEAKALLEFVRQEIRRMKNKNLEVVFCPPFLWMENFNNILGGAGRQASIIKLGSQNIFWEFKGAYTGEISAPMLKGLGVKYVIIGHSERRNYFSETDQMVNQKLKAALKFGLKPILCIGEKERGASDQIGEALSIVSEQLKQGLEGISSSKISEITIAYEPIWAIGTGDACSSDQAMEAGLFIRKILAKMYNRKAAENIRIVYGGSVNSQNAASYVKEARLNGLLVGGASLIGSEFVKIIESVK
jgi:triosephosphate isomerase